MRQYLRINMSPQRVPSFVFLVVFSCVISTGRQEMNVPDSFSTLLDILDDGDVERERRDISEDFLFADGSGTPPPGTPPPGVPVIVESEEKKFVLRTPGQLSVDVGCTVYAVKGAQITVSCRASAPTGNPKIEWFRNGFPVQENRFSGDVAVISGALRIRRLGRFNEGSYRCRASNKAGRTEAFFTAKIILPSLPTILKSEGDVTFGPNDKVGDITIGSDVTVYRGATLTIRCPVEGIGKPMVFWTSQGRPVIGKAVQVGNDLVIRDIDRRYALTYKCTARTHRGQVHSESTVSIKDLDPPRIKYGTRNLRKLEEETNEVEIYVGTKLTVISETQVTVRCEASMDPAPEISWEIQGKSSDFKDVVSLSEDNSTLTLSQPRVEDSGEYTCTASNNVGRDSKSSSVEVLNPVPPTILHSNQKVTLLKQHELLEARIGDEITLLAGMSVTITCPTSGLPTPTVKWKKEDEDLSISGGSLTIKNATTQDSGVITCEAVNRAGKFSYSSDLQVIAAEKPEIESSSGRVTGIEGMEEAVVKIGQDLRVVEGLIVRLICPVSRGFPTPQVTWFLNDRLVQSSERFLIDRRSNSLILNGIDLEDTGQVSCVANNSAGQASESSFISILGESSAQIVSGNSSVESIKEIKKITVQIGDSVHVLSGSDVTIVCSAHGTPPPVTTWRWNGRQVISGSRRGQLIIKELSDGSRLTVQQFTSENVGQYECVASNTRGADRVASRITALDATFPKIEVASTSVEHITDLDPVSVQIGTRVTLLPGVRLEITCTASGIPEPSISWLRKGKQIISSGRFSIHNGALVIHATQLSDRGSFTCAANNTLGRTAFSSRVDVMEPIKPRIMQTGRNMTVETIARLSDAVGGNILCRDGIDLELTCTVQGTPTPKIVWLRGNKTVGTGFKLSLGILKEESSGDYTCLATNVGGEDRKTTKLIVRSAIPPVIQTSDKVLESFEEGKYLVVTIGTRLKVVQGTKIDLICRVSAFPRPKVSWAKGNEPLDERFERQGFFIYPFNGTSSTLLIRGSRQSSEDEVYGCTAYNGGGSVSAFSYVTFYERVPPTIKSTWVTGSVGVKESLLSREPVKVTIGDNVRVFTKTKVTIECPVFAIPLAKVVWTHNGGPLPSKHQISGTDLVTSAESDTSDSGRYSCAATNRLGKDASWSDVTFMEPRLPTITAGESSIRLITTVEYTATIGTNITTLVGSNITFVCASEGLPIPSVSWRKDDEALNVSTTLYTLYALAKNATGVYSCVAENLAGQTVVYSGVTILDRAIETATLPRIVTTRTNQVSIDDRRIVEHIIGGNVSVIEGRDLLLRCPVEGVPLPSTSWLFNGLPVEVSDTLQIDEITGNLKITEMTPDDGGMYTCVATNIAGETKEISFTTVIEPTFPVIDSSNISIQVFDPSRKALQVKAGSHVTTLTGTPVTITCDATGFPEPKVSWIKGFTAITGSDAERLIVGKTKINLLRAARSDSGLYMCTASNPGGQAAAVSNITFVEPVKPRILSVTKERELLQRLSVNITIGEKLTILDRSNVTVECMAKGIPPPSLSWRKDGDILENTSAANILHLRGVTLEDAGRYTCTADNFVGSDSQSAVLSVRVGRKPLIMSQYQEILVDDKVTTINLDVGSNLTLVAGSRVKVICEADGVPEPSITWQQDGEEVLSSWNKTSLTIDNPGQVNLRTVSCAANNVLGIDTKASYLTILEPSKPAVQLSPNPKTIEAQDRSPITLTIGDNVTALTNTSITIQCPTSGVPTPTVTWTKGGQEIPSGGRYTVQDNGSLVISEADIEQSARYTCTANSVAGKDSASSTVQVVEPAKPSIEVPEAGQEISVGDGSPVTINIGDNVTAASNTTITIRCPVSGVPTPSVNWKKEGLPIVEGEKISVTEDNSLVIREAEVGDSAKYTCSVQNSFGKDAISSVFKIIEPSKPVVKFSDDPKTIEAQDRSPITLTIGDNVTALTNTSITIQCPTSGVPKPTVTWTRDGQEIPSGGRYTVQDDGSLVISEADEEDSARYTCTAESVAGKDSASSTVRVLEPTKPAIEVPEPGREIPAGDGSPVTMNIGDNVTAASNTTITIRCPVSGVPTPSVTWEKDGVQVTEGETINIADDNTLIIKEAEIEDGGKYTCSVDSNFGKKHLSSIVKIIDPFKPDINIPDKPKTIEAQDRSPITLTIGDNVTALTNTSITIQCPTSGVPTPTVTWTKDGQEIPSGGRYTVQDDGSLVISEADEEDSARYTCTAESVAGKDSVSSTIKIVEPSKPVIEVPESGKEIPVGDGSPVTMNIGDNVTAASNSTITIRCPVSGVPTPSVTWTKDGVQIVPGNELSLTDDNSLVIEGADVEDSANYTCSVQSKFGKDDISSIVEIEEYSKPAIDTTDEPKTIEAQDRSPITLTIGDNVTALTNTSITIQCPTSGVPTPTVTWTKDGQEIPSGSRYTVQDDGSLVISEADEDDNARYTCTSESVAGKDSASSTVQVVGPSIPAIEVPESGKEIPVGDGSPVTMNIGDNVTAASNTTINIRCPVSGVPAPSVTWTKDGVQIIPGDELSLTDDNSLVIRGADVGDSAKYTCSVQSKFGKDDISSIVKIKEPSKPAIDTTDEPTTIKAQDRSPITMTIGDNVTALTNTSITIQCPTSGVPTPTVTWTKDGQEIPSGDRYTVQDDGSLVISKTGEEDSARYTCTAESVAGKDSASSMVQVVEPVKPAIETPEPAREIPVGDGSPVTMNIGDNVTAASNTTITIKCPVSGVPTPSVTWTKDGASLAEEKKVSIRDDNSLVIRGADHSAKYTCSVNSVVGTNSLSSVVKIVGPTKPSVETSVKPKTIEAQDRSPITLTIGDNVTALTNTSITIQCSTSGVPTPTVTWTKDGQEIPSGGRYTVQDDGSLVISKTEADDNARYTCIADSVVGKDSASSTVEVLDPVKPVIDVPESGREIPVGDGSPVTMNIGDNVTAASNTTITILCPVSGVPTPSVIWEKDGAEVVGGEKLSIINENNLVIVGAQTEDSAKYTCRVESEFGKESLSSIVRIKGPSKPMVKISDKPTTVEAQDLSPITLTIGDNVTALTNTSITIQCPTSGVPAPTITWTKDGQEIPSGGRYKVQDNGSLVISGTDEEVGARYTCTANNVAGKASASSTVQVLEPVKPAIEVLVSGKIPVGDGSPVNINIGDNVTAASNTTITIRCPVSGVPTPSVTWFKDGVQVIEGERIYFTDNSSLVIDGAEIGESAKYTCIIQTVFGKDDLSSIVTIVDPVRPKIASSTGDITSFHREPVNVTIGQNVLTVIDTKLSIKCTTTGIPIPKVTWTKGNESLPSDGRMTVKGGTLVIVELETADSGNYTCSAENAAGIAAVSSNVTVAVPAPPEITLTGIKDVQVVEPKSVEVVVGSTILTISGNNVSLACRVKGFPTPSVQWTKDGVSLDTEGSTLRLQAVEANDTGVYTCTATSSPLGLFDWASSNLTVIAIQPPVISTDEQTIEVLKIEDVSVAVGGLVTTLDGNRVNILCEVSGFPDPQITWERDGVQLQRGDKRYTIESAVQNDSGNYTCKASNIAGEANATSRLNVLVGSAPKIDSTQESKVHMRIDFFAITIGTNLTTLASSGLEISCPASGFPTPVIQWYREGVPVQPGMMLNVDKDTGTLFTLSISHRKGGTFTCEASNALGSDSASSVVTVLVPGAPQINISRVAQSALESREPVSIKVGQTLSVLSGTKVSIECPVSGVPKPDVTWSQGESKLVTDRRVLIKDSVLVFDKITGGDAGVYLCRAVNIAGNVVASSLVKVTETSRPKISADYQTFELLQSGSFTVDIGSSVTTVTGNALSIRCNATGVPKPEITWSKDDSLLGANGPVYVLRSLKSSDSGRYQCTASNIDGTDVQDIRINVLDGSAPKITSPEENIVAVSGENEVTIEIGGNLTTVVGTSVMILCPVMALPNATITWLFNGSSVEEENIRSGAVTMIGVTPENVGSYTCIARNSYGVASKTTFLSLIIPVEPKILSSNKDIQDFKSTRHELVIGDNLETLVSTVVYIRCPVTGNPAPLIEWKKSGFSVTTSSSLQIVNNTLALFDSTWSDTGSYTCTASNGAGSDEKETFLKFMAPEKPSIRGESIDVESYDGQPITVAVGGTLKVLQKTTVNIRCVASGIPEPSVFWNSSSDMQPANKFDVNQGGQLLTIREVDTSDSGKYMCSAVNKAGEDSQAAVLEVVEATLPTITTSDATVSWFNRESRVLPVGGTIEVLSGTKLTLTCKYSAFPEPDVQWTALGEEGHDSGQDAGNEVINGSLVLMALQPSDSGQYVCSVRNVAGTASASTTLKVLDPQSPSISSSQDSVVSLSEIVPVRATAGSVVTVLSGTRITITCSADGIPTPTMAWSKGDQLLHTTSSPDNRVTAQSGILTIDNATADDTGDYQCTAMSEVGSDQESTKVTVVEPSKPIIQQPDVGKIPLSNKTSVDVSVGSDVTVLTYTRVNITCEADGVPRAKITWLRDGKPISSAVGSSLVLSISTLEDAGQVTCFAGNLAGNATLSTNMDVIEPLLPRIKSGEGEIVALNKRRAVTGSVGVSVQTFTGTSLTLKCSAEGSPKPTVSWSKNGERLESKDRISIKGDGTMIIKNTRVSDTGRYMCFAKSVIGEAYEASSVYVSAPIRPKIKRSRSYIIWYERQPFKGKVGDNLTTLKGRKLTLTCPALGLPKPAISWYRGGMRMKSGGNYVAIGNTLIMYNLDPMDTDRYTCVARNFAGVTSATTTLKVHEPMAPKIMSSYGHKESLQEPKRLNVTIGDDVSILQGGPLTIKCPVLGVPEPKVKWLKDRKMLNTNDRMEMDCTGILNIFKMELEDSGDYVCTAENFLGMDMAFSSVTVYEAIKPSVEISGRVYISSGNIVNMHVGDNLTAIVKTPISINCSAKGIPKPNMRWEMNGQQLGNGGNYKTDNNGALVIRGLEVPGEFTCIAENFVGQDGASSFITVLEPTKPSIITPENPRTIEAQDRRPITLTIGDNVTALTNTSITIQCPTSGVPTPTVRWTVNGKEIRSDSGFSVQDDGSLLIHESQQDGNGRYICTSGNSVGNTSASSIVQIVDPIKPVIEVPEPGREIPIGDGSPVTMNIGDNVTAASNTTITIRCPVSGVPTPSVNWKKDGDEITSGVEYLVTSDNSLVIERAVADDSGEYTCSVKSVSGSDSGSSSVKISGPSRPVVKTSGEPKAREAQDQSPITLTIGDNVTALTNTSITIQCPTSGVPMPTVTWTKDGQEIPSGGRYTVQDDGSLMISEADENDNARYTCTAESVAGKDSASSTVQVVEPSKPAIEVPEPGREIPVGDGSPVTMNIGDNVTAASNTTITIRCPVSGVPTPSVTWTKDGVEISPKDKFIITREDSLVIERAEVGDGAMYSCTVRGLTGSDSASSKVQIIEPSKPIVQISDDPKTIEAQDLSPITLTIGDNVTTLTNTSITIQCPTSGVPTPTVTWTKDGQEIPSGGRHTVQNDGSLVISEADKEDSARYTCTAGSVAGKDSASSAVEVIEPAKPAIEVPAPGREIPVGDGSPVTMNIGDNVTAASNTTITIRCPVSGVPTPSVTWTKDGVEITPGDKFIITSEDSLVIERTKADDSAMYSCTVRGLTGSDSASSRVQIIEPSKPIVQISDDPKTIEAQDQSPITLTIGDNVTALTNTSITIQCPTSGVPTPTVTWTKDGQGIPSGGRYTVQDDGSLVIGEADEEDSARYTCTAESVAGKDSASSTVKVNGLKIPTILVQRPGPMVSIGDGRPVVTPVGSQITEIAYVKITLTCPTEGLPSPKITWRKDGVELVPNERYAIDSKGSLTIREALTEDSGKFTCSAQNAAGLEEVTSSLDIREPFEPLILPSKGSISSDDHTNVIAGVGSKINAFKDATISITCAVKGVPKPEVSWTKDGQSITLGERVALNSNGTLIIRNSSVKDSGAYTCTAKSRSGQTSATSPLTVADTMHPVIVSLNIPVAWYKAEPLTATIGTSIQTLPGTQISLSCPATGVPPPAISWRKENETLVQSGTELILGAVNYENEGRYTCVATNIAGSAEASSDLAVEAPTQPSIKRSVEEVSWDKESPLTVAVGSRVDIINGSSLILRCIASGLPQPEVTWTRGIEALSDDDKYNISKQTLTISNVQFADADEYTCTATNQAGQDAATTELVVKGPGGPIISPERRFIVDVNSSKPVIAPIGANVTTVVNATVIMTCPSQGSPQPTVTWNHDQQFVVPGGRYSMNESSLVISGVRLEDAGKYQCTASNRFGRDVESLSLTVTVPPLISNVKGMFELTDIRDLVSITTGAVVTIPRGVSIIIKCLATGVPAPNITWYRRRPGMKKKYAIVTSDALKVMHDRSLSISHAAVSDAAYYTCVATNIAGKDEGSTLLNVGTPPEIPSHWRGVKSRFNIPDHARRTSVGSIATIVKGATLHIKCAVEGNPKPTITWVVSTSSQEERHSVLEDDTLVVPSADLEDEGNYTCIANNSFGTLMRTTTVSILVPPEILDRHFRHIFINDKRIEGYAMAHAGVKRNTISSLTVERGYNLILICTVVGKPKPHVTWRRNGVLIKNDTRHLLLPNGVLLVRKVEAKESGQYKCVASNVVGKDQRSVRLIVKNEATGYWKATAWSKCGNCVTHLRGWQERHISCMGPAGKAISDLHCIHKHKPTKRRRCIHRDCHVIWRTTAWSACSRSCGSHGVKLRNVQCVFAKSLKPAKGQCGWQKKPPLQEPCNRKSCLKENCVDKVKYCQRVKQIGMCPVYSRWCCNTCR